MKNSSIKDANESDNVEAAAVLRFIHLCHDNVEEEPMLSY